MISLKEFSFRVWKESLRLFENDFAFNVFRDKGVF
jgi:hypothetical protein